jgi:hypothetical protein
MSIADPAHARQSQQERDGEATVHHAVVENDVSDAEHRHSRTRSDRDGGRDSMHVAPDHHERGRDRSVRGGQRVVDLEATRTTAVVRAVNAPQAMVPHAAVEQACPGLHGGGDEDRDEHTERDGRKRAHEVTS